MPAGGLSGMDDTTFAPSTVAFTSSKEVDMADTDPIGWRAVVYGTPVTTVDGVRVGTIREVLGSDSEDIFHGLRVGLARRLAWC